jgi:hypothetical protein
VVIFVRVLFYLIKIGKSKKDRQLNGQKQKVKKSNNDLQSTTHKTNDRVKRTPLYVVPLHDIL